MSLSNRNPFTSDPVPVEDMRELRNRLLRYWEDTSLVTKLGGDSIICTGNLIGVLNTAIRAMEEKPEVKRGCAACQGDPEAHDRHVCGKADFS